MNINELFFYKAFPCKRKTCAEEHFCYFYHNPSNDKRRLLIDFPSFFSFQNFCKENLNQDYDRNITDKFKLNFYSNKIFFTQNTPKNKFVRCQNSLNIQEKNFHILNYAEENCNYENKEYNIQCPNKLFCSNRHKEEGAKNDDIFYYNRYNKESYSSLNKQRNGEAIIKFKKVYDALCSENSVVTVREMIEIFMLIINTANRFLEKHLKFCENFEESKINEEMEKTIKSFDNEQLNGNALKDEIKAYLELIKYFSLPINKNLDEKIKQSFFYYDIEENSLNLKLENNSNYNLKNINQDNTKYPGISQIKVKIDKPSKVNKYTDDLQEDNFNNLRGMNFETRKWNNNINYNIKKQISEMNSNNINLKPNKMLEHNEFEVHQNNITPNINNYQTINLLKKNTSPSTNNDFDNNQASFKFKNNNTKNFARSSYFDNMKGKSNKQNFLSEKNLTDAKDTIVNLENGLPRNRSGKKFNNSIIKKQEEKFQKNKIFKQNIYKELKNIPFLTKNENYSKVLKIEKNLIFLSDTLPRKDEVENLVIALLNSYDGMLIFGVDLNSENITGINMERKLRDNFKIYFNGEFNHILFEYEDYLKFKFYELRDRKFNNSNDFDNNINNNFINYQENSDLCVLVIQVKKVRNNEMIFDKRSRITYVVKEKFLQEFKQKRSKLSLSEIKQLSPQEIIKFGRNRLINYFQEKYQIKQSQYN